jgi:hypothetical protein
MAPSCRTTSRPSRSSQTSTATPAYVRGAQLDPAGLEAHGVIAGDDAAIPAAEHER